MDRGDLTPFLISFSELVVDAMESMLDSLQEKQSDLVDAVDAVNHTIATEEDAGLWRVAFILAQATLFSETAQPPKSCAWRPECLSLLWPRSASASKSWAF